MPTRAELISIAEQAIKEGDDATAHEAMNMIDQIDLSKRQAVPISDVPLTPDQQGYAEQQAAQKEMYANQPAEPSVMDKLGAGLKAGGVMLGNLVPATIGSIGGSIYGLASGQGEEEMIRGAQQFSPFSTEDPLARQYMESAGNVLGAIDPALPLSAARMAKNEMPAAVAGKDVARNVGTALKEDAQTAKTVIEAATPPDVKTIDTVQRIKSGSTDNDLAKVQLKLVDATKKDAQGNLLPTAYKVVEDPEAKKAITQGFDDGEVQLIKTSAQEDAAHMQRMVDISEKGKKNAAFGADNRPADVIGGLILSDYKNLQSKNKIAGAAIDKAAKKDLRGNTVDVSKPVQDFMQGLTDDLGVKFSTDEAGRIIPSFKNSEIRSKSSYKKEQQFLINTINDLANSGMPDAYNVHVFKRAIDNIIYSGKTSGLNKTVENSVKKLRAGLDETLDSNFPEYNKANIDYSKTIGAMADLQDAAGKKIDFNAAGADKQLGILSNRLLSNVQSRQQLTNAIQKLQETSKEYGGSSSYDPSRLVMMANILDRRFGAHAQRSLLGEAEKASAGSGAMAQLGEKAARGGLTAVDVGVAGSKIAHEKIKGINNDNAYKSLRALLAKQRKQNEQFQKSASQ